MSLFSFTRKNLENKTLGQNEQEKFITMLKYKIEQNENKLIKAKNKEKLIKIIQEDKEVLAYLQKQEYFEIDELKMDDINAWIKEHKTWLTSSGFWIEKEKSKNGFVIYVSFLNFAREYEKDAPSLKIRAKSLDEDFLALFKDRNNLLIEVE